MNAMVIRNCGETLGSGINFLTKKTPLIVTVALAVLSLTPAYRIPAALAMRATSLYISGRLLFGGAGAVELIKIASIALGIIGIYAGGTAGFLLLAASLALDIGFQIATLSGENPSSRSAISLFVSGLMLYLLGVSSIVADSSAELTALLYAAAATLQTFAAIAYPATYLSVLFKENPNESFLSKGFDFLCYTALAATALTSFNTLESHMQNHYAITVDKTTEIYNRKGDLFATLEPGKHDIYLPINKGQPLLGEGVGRIYSRIEFIAGAPCPIYPIAAEYGEIHRLENTE